MLGKRKEKQGKGSRSGGKKKSNLARDEVLGGPLPRVKGEGRFLGGKFLGNRETMD